MCEKNQLWLLDAKHLHISFLYKNKWTTWITLNMHRNSVLSEHIYLYIQFIWGQRRQRRGIDFGDGGINIQDFCLSPVFVRFCFLLFFHFSARAIAWQEWRALIVYSTIETGLMNASIRFLLLFLVFSISFCLSFAIYRVQCGAFIHCTHWNETVTNKIYINFTVAHNRAVQCLGYGSLNLYACCKCGTSHANGNMQQTRPNSDFVSKSKKKKNGSAEKTMEREKMKKRIE